MSIGLFKSLAIPGIAKKRGAAVRPSFLQNYLGTQLPAGVNFSRASNATQFDSQGRLVWAPHNLCSRGNMASGWTIGAEGVLTVLPGALPSGRDGFNITTSAASPVSLTGIGSQTVVVGAAHVFTVKVRYVNHPWIRIAIYSGSSSVNQVRAWFNMQTGVVGTVQNNGTATGASFDTPIDCGNGWWQLTIRGTVPFTAVTDGALLVAMAAADASTTRPGVGSSFDVGEPLLEVAGPQAPQVFTANHLTAGAAWYGPRLDYNPVTLSPRGLLVEETRTNSLPNSAMVGGVGGTPGTPPTGWSFSAVAGVTVTTTYGTIDGMPYVDITYSGTNTSGAAAFPTVSFSTATAISANNGQTWTASAYIKKIAGADPLNSWSFSVAGRDSGGSLVAGQSATGSAADGPTLKESRNSKTFTFSSASVAFVQERLVGNLGVGAAIDITIRIACPQLEQGASASSVIPTFGAAATRAGDVADLANAPPWNAAGTSFYCEYERYAIPPSGVNSAPFYFGDTTNSNFVGMFFGTSDPTTFRIDMMVSSVLQAQVFANPPSSEVANTVYKSAGRLAPNNANIARNGVLSTADTSVSMLSAIPTDRWTLGRSNATNTLQMHGWLRRLDIYTVALPDATLQALTS